MGGEGLVKGEQLVRVQVVHHRHDFSARDMDIRHVPEKMREIEFRAAARHLDAAPSGKRSAHHEQVRRAVALAFEILDGRLAGACRQRRPGLPGQLPTRLVHAN